MVHIKHVRNTKNNCTKSHAPIFLCSHAEMPDAIHGTLLTCDNPPIKTFIESLNESLPQESQFIISKSLDETHLLIRSERVTFVQSKVKEFTDKNQYTAPRDNVQS